MKKKWYWNKIIVFLLLCTFFQPNLAIGLDVAALYNGKSSVKLITRLNTPMHNGMLTGGGASDNLRYFVSTSADRTCKAWEVSTGKLLATFRVEMDSEVLGTLINPAITNDGDLVAAPHLSPVNGKQFVYLFSVETGRMIGSVSLPFFMSGTSFPMPFCAFSPDGEVLAFATSRTMALIDMKTLKVMKRVLLPGLIEGVHYAENGNLLAHHNKGFVVLDKDLNELFSSHDKLDLRRACFSPDGSKVAWVGGREDSLLHLVEVNNGRLKDLHIPSGLHRKRLSWGQEDTLPTIYALKYDVIQILQGQKQYTIDRLNTNDHALEAAYCLEGDNHLVVTPNGFSLIHEKSSAVYERTVPALTLYTEDYKKNVLFAVKNDGSVFFLEDVNGQGLIVDMVSDTVAVAKTAPSGFQKPIRVLNSSTVEIPGGQSRNPVINGKRVRFPLNNPATCYTIMPNGDVAFGSFFFLAGYSSDGTIKWVDITFAPTLAVVPIDEGRRIVSLSADGTVRWHDGTNGETLLASYVHPDLKRRVTWTPEGFFDHSAGGESLVGFHHNQGAGRQARFYSIERFYENLYRPDLVRARLLGKSEDGIIKARKEVGEILDMLEKGLPPEVSASCVVRDGVLNVDVSIEDGGSGVGPVSYFLNGVKVAEDAPPAVSPVKGKRYALTKQLVTAPGENVIEVRSESPLSHIESNTARVVLTNTFAAERKKTLYVLAVGIDKYAAKEFVLNNAVNDVRYFSSTISEIAHKRFADVIVETVENSQATTANVLKAISSVGGRTSPDDCFVLYLSGHGLTVDNTYYFLPSELQGFTKESVALNAISQQALNKALLSVAAQESLIILDTCQSGSFAFSSPLGLDMKAATGRLNRATGRAVLTAATASGDALEGFKGHGLFTYVLVDGLQGKADAAFEDESVSLVELGDYILNNVPTLSSEVWGVTQRPIFYHKGNDFTLTSTER